MTYDQQFNTLTIKDALNREVETYTLDIQDRPITISNLESQTMNVAYGVGDMVKSVTRFDGTTVSNSYDGQARLIGTSWPDASTTFSYYDNALLKTVASESGTFSNTYDNANRLAAVASVYSVYSVVNEYLLDGIGNATNVLVSVDGSGILTNAYTFDAAERVSAITGESGTFAFDYSPYNGLVASVSNTTSGIHADYQFDDLDRLTNIVWRNAANSVLRSFGYGYNSSGMITNVSRESAAENVAYGYDSLDRLTSATAPYLTASYGWDLAGNPSSRTENGTNTTYTLGTGNKLTSWTGGSYGHNSAGCVTNITRGGGTLSLAWNSRYQLTAVSTNGTVAEEYTYGPLGNRISTVVNGVTNHHVYEGAHCVADLDADGDLLRSYQPGPGIDNWLSMTVHTGATPVVYTYLTDHLGTVHAVADESGAIVESYRYDPHGKVLGVWNGSGTPLTKSAIGNRILWQGREYSWATGLYYFRSRYYDPQTARWLSRDKLGISGGINLYQAFSGNPVMFRDPSGHCPDDSYAWWNVSQRIIESHDNSWNNIATAHDLYLFSLAGGGVSGNPVLTYDQAQNFAHVVDAGMLVLPQALMNYWALSSALTITADASIVTVTRWQTPSSTALQSGNWVVRGGRTRWNWVMSGKMNPLRPKYHVPFRNGRSFTVPRSTLRAPTGIERTKTLPPWRQSRYYP